MAFLVGASMAVAGAADATTAAVDTTASGGAKLFVVGLQNVSNFIGSPCVTDSASNTWSLGTLFTGSSSRYARMAYCVAPTTSATHTFSFTAANSAFYPVICVAAFTNIPSSSTFDAESAGAETLTAAVTVQPGSLTPANANNLLVTFVGGDPYATISINSGFTIPAAATFEKGSHGGGTQGGALAYLIQTATTAQNPTWTAGTNDATIMGLMMAFKESGGGGPVFVAPGPRVVNQAVNRAGTY